MKTLLIDGDIIAYRTACSIDREKLVYTRINAALLAIQATYSSTEYRIFLTGKETTNFRKIINPAYKANRDQLEKPYWLPLCNAYLHEAWEADYIQGAEADDALGYFQTDNTVICTTDKDLNMIPGEHYNFVLDISYHIQPGEAIQFFYKQMLIGDTSDNIQGVSKLGPVKASKLIDPIEIEQEMFDIVYTKYKDPKRFAMNACCLWIQQQKGITWAQRSQHLTLPEECKQEVAVILDCMNSSQINI